MDKEPLIPKHGGYRKLKSFQVAQLVYDVTVRFCDLYIERRSRTHDQMVQAARSGVQNIAEGNQASGTSKKTELKLTNVARTAWRSTAWTTRTTCGDATCRACHRTTSNTRPKLRISLLTRLTISCIMQIYTSTKNE